jgi:hypothetical protein
MLKFKGAWRFTSPGEMPRAAIRETFELIGKIATQGNRWDILERFKTHFANAAGISDSRSSSESWAETDLRSFMDEAASNAPLFIEAFHDACQSLQQKKGLDTPDVAVVNRMLTETDSGYQIEPPDLLIDMRRPSTNEPIHVLERPPTLAEQAVEVLQRSLQRSEELLSQQGHEREAVQEILWLLESVATAFRGVNTEAGAIGGTYFNQIVHELREHAGRRTTLDQILNWMTTMHGYLSAPAGGGIRHGMDLNRGVTIGPNEARLFCNLARSYIGFLLAEHERLVVKDRR